MIEIGTAGGAIAISIVALVSSVALPLYLEKRREKIGARKEMHESYRRITELGLMIPRLPPAGPEALAQVKAWLGKIMIETATSSSALWHEEEVLRANKNLLLLLLEQERLETNNKSSSEEIIEGRGRVGYETTNLSMLVIAYASWKLYGISYADVDRLTPMTFQTHEDIHAQD